MIPQPSVSTPANLTARIPACKGPSPRIEHRTRDLNRHGQLVEQRNRGNPVLE
jgi:hypothetical protein